MALSFQGEWNGMESALQRVKGLKNIPNTCYIPIFDVFYVYVFYECLISMYMCVSHVQCLWKPEMV